MPNSQQAISEAIADPIQWRIFATLGGHKFIKEVHRLDPLDHSHYGPQLSCGGTCQIWTRFLTGKRCFDNTQKGEYELTDLAITTPSNAWWRHQMETVSALLAICAGNSLITGEFPAHRPVKRSFDIFFDLRLKKRLSKQSWGWWFETLSRPFFTSL